MSTDHSGKRLKVSSRAIRPSVRAEGGAQAEVDAVAEGQVVVELPVDVEGVGVRVGPLVPAG